VSDDRACTWATDADRRRDQRRQKIARIKAAFFMRCHGVWWRTLHFTRLARPYSIAMCRAGLYRRFPNGRCMWCGEVKPRASKKMRFESREITK
jgi:hypothetical protein